MERLTDPLTTTDAKLWADEFMKVKARLGEQKFDHAMMLGWFANAIMVGYDEGSRRAKADAQATVEALQREVNTLNQLLRDKGLGQGEIDGMAAEQNELQTIRDERDRLRKALVKCRRELWHCNEQLKYKGATEGFSVTEALSEAQAALTPAGQRWTRVVRGNRTTELVPLTPNEATE